MTGNSPLSTVFLAEETLISFIEALYRIFKVGIYYPTGHAVLDQTAGKCVVQLRELSPTLKQIRIVIDSNGLLVEELRLSERSVAVKELHQLFIKLGLRSIEIDRAISPLNLLSVVKKLLNWRMQLEATQSFINFDLGDLPKGFRLEQQEFLIDKRTIKSDGEESGYKQNIDEICRALAEQGVNSQQLENCQQLLEKLAASGENQNQDVKGFPNATWRDVQELLYTVVTDAYSLDEKRHGNVANTDINILASIFKSLEFGKEDKRSKQTIDLLISHLTGKRDEQKGKVEKASESKKQLRQLLEDDQKVTLDDLKKFIFQNSIPLKVLQQITSVDSSEEISILMQLFSPDQEELYKKRLEKKLKAILAKGVTDREKAVLIGGIMQLVDQGSISDFRHLLSIVLRTLRELEQMSSLSFVVALWSKMPFAMHLLLWPFVVNELVVVGEASDRETFMEATEIASHMHVERMKSLCPQLELMDGFLERKLCDDVFSPVKIKGYRLFAVLLETSLGDVLGEIILSSLKEHPQDWLFKAIGPILTIEVPAHLEFLQTYLSQAHLEEPPLPLKMAGGKIIIDFLQNVTDEEKESPWLVKTISATVELNIKGMVDMLTMVVKDKKMGILPLWPKKCRSAAADTLKTLKRRGSLSKLL